MQFHSSFFLDLSWATFASLRSPSHTSDPWLEYASLHYAFLHNAHSLLGDVSLFHCASGKILGTAPLHIETPMMNVFVYGLPKHLTLPSTVGFTGIC